MSFHADLGTVKTALLGAVTGITPTVPVFHYYAKDNTVYDRYIVWSEDMEAGHLNGDGKPAYRRIQGTIDFFTKTEYDALAISIETALKDASIPFRLIGVDVDEDSEKIHYSWVFEVVGEK